MNCRSVEPWLLSESDGVLTPAQHAELAQHLDACASCRQFRADLAAAMNAVQTEARAVRLPDIDAEWREVQAKIGAAKTRSKSRRLAPVVWLSAPLAAAAAVALAFFVNRPLSTPHNTDGSEIAAQVDYVDVPDASATPIVYTDKESGWLVVWAESTDTARVSG